MKVTAKTRTIIIGMLTTVILATAIITGATLLSRKKLAFSAEFYYLCYNSPTDAYSASSMSSVVHSYGGAGYIIKNGGKFYVTVSCYYAEEDAQSVARTLALKGLDCLVVREKAGGYSIAGYYKNSAVKRQLYEGNLNTLLELSEMCYSLANALDDGTCNQQSANAVLQDVRTGLDALARNNVSNCFAGEIDALRAECADVSFGYIYSRDVRRMQIAITDSIANVKLY